jgi:hypothetical protein
MLSINGIFKPLTEGKYAALHNKPTCDSWTLNAVGIEKRLK